MMGRPQLKLFNLTIRPSIIDGKILWNVIDYYWKDQWVLTSGSHYITLVDKNRNTTSYAYIKEVYAIEKVKNNDWQTWLGIESNPYYFVVFGKRLKIFRKLAKKIWMFLMCYGS